MFYELKDRMLLIPNTICCTDILNLSQEVIHQGFKDGEYVADRFDRTFTHPEKINPLREN